MAWLVERTLVKIFVPAGAARMRYKSVRNLPTFGMWADRDDIPDGVSYENALRSKPRE